MNRYLRLGLMVLLAAAGVSALSRLPRRAEVADAPAPVPVAELAMEIGDEAVTPGSAAVPKNHRVRLTIRNAGTRTHAVRLAGYERDVSVTLAPDSIWRGEFLAELPGEDFAWLVDGEPRGRLAVTGSHLVEGHR